MFNEKDEFLHSDACSDEISKLLRAGDFDPEWYVEQYSDVAVSGMDPAEHYVWIGKRLGRKGKLTAIVGSKEIPAISSAESSLLDEAVPYRADLLVTDPITVEIREIIERSGLFDEGYYLREYGDDLLCKDDLLYDYINSYNLGRDRDPNHLFSTSYYAATHLDVVGIHPFFHYVQYGVQEGRAAFSPKKVNDFLAGSENIPLMAISDILPEDCTVNILYWDGGNFFLKDVAEYIRIFLTERGYVANIHTDTPESDDGASLNLVVAPHEFCVCGPGATWSEDQYRQAAYVATEQWHTSWFALSLKFLQLTELGVFDLNPSSAAGLAKMGMRTAFLPLLPIRGSCFDIADEPLEKDFTRLKYVKPLSNPEDLLDRPYDVCLVAVLNDRRAKMLAAMAPTLAAYETFIHCPRFERPVHVGDPDMLSVRGFSQIARNSRVMLNLHQGESHYLEWQRMFLVGMMQGCVVLSEPCTPNRLVRPGEHYLECDFERMSDMLAFLLSTEEGNSLMSGIHDNNIALRAAILSGERFS